MMRRMSRTPARGLVIAIAVLSMTIMGVSGVVWAQAIGDEDLVYEGPEHPPRQTVNTVDEAQSLVPYPIRIPEFGGEMVVAEVAVQQVPVETRDDDLFIVFITFRGGQGEVMEMRQTNFGAIPWTDSQRENESVRQRAVAINGSQGIEATAREGEKVLGGYVFWEYGEVTYELAAAGWTGDELMKVAETVK